LATGHAWASADPSEPIDSQPDTTTAEVSVATAPEESLPVEDAGGPETPPSTTSVEVAPESTEATNVAAETTVVTTDAAADEVGAPPDPSVAPAAVSASDPVVSAPTDTQPTGESTTLSQLSTRTALSISTTTDWSFLGDTVELIATVTLTDGTPVTDVWVEFVDADSNLSHYVSVDTHGRATYATSTLAVGLHRFSARFGGDYLFEPSHSPWPEIAHRVVEREQEATPVTPTVVRGGDCGAVVAYTIAATEGVVYLVDGAATMAGTYELPAGATVEVTAAAAEGYQLDGELYTEFTGGPIEPCDPPVTTEAPTTTSTPPVTTQPPTTTTDPPPPPTAPASIDLDVTAPRTNDAAALQAAPPATSFVPSGQLPMTR
jgi:hypothetical protein